jgi:hypothetical protein
MPWNDAEPALQKPKYYQHEKTLANCVASSSVRESVKKWVSSVCLIQNQIQAFKLNPDSDVLRGDLRQRI